MSIPERHMYKAIINENGDTVTGYYYQCMGFDVITLHIIHSIDGGVDADYDIDPSTLEPVAVKRLNVRKHKFLGATVGECPNCDATLNKANSDKSNGTYCFRCGQRIDWSGE